MKQSGTNPGSGVKAGCGAIRLNSFSNRGVFISACTAVQAEYSQNETGLILGVGMIVDASVVMIENIFVYRIRGAKAIVAAELGSGSIRSANKPITKVIKPTIINVLPKIRDCI